MNEDQIAKQLSDALPPSAPITSDYPPPPTPEEPQNFVDKMLPEELLTQSRLLDYLQVPTAEHHTPVVSDYINTVYQWARDTAGTGEIEQIIRVISEQEMHMGIKLRSDKLMRLAEYVKINRVRQNLAARERVLYG